MTKDEAIAIILSFWVNDEWQYVFMPKPIAEKVSEALTVVTKVTWGIEKVTNPDIPQDNRELYSVVPTQKVDWVKL